MAYQGDEGLPDQEEEGGPVKSFLDHLEDLRWTLIKSASVLGVAIIICLIGGNTIARILNWPRERAGIPYKGTNQIATFYFATNRVWEIEVPPGTNGAFPYGTNILQDVRLVPTPIVSQNVTNLVLAIVPDYSRPATKFRKLNIDVIILSPAGAFLVAFQIAIYAGIVVSSPFLIYFIGQFVVPALKAKEKRYVFRGFAVGTVLFACGVGFCYFVLLPVALSASVLYANWLGLGANTWRAEEYYSFVCKFMLGMGIGFEQPVVLLALVKIGILDYAKLKAFRKYMIVINLILGAVLTTPEVITQILLAVPLQILYEVSVWIAWYWERTERKQRERDNAPLAG
jgi:sec-independent protein translocase protein TatC